MWNSRSSAAHWLWTHNPFYFISALLMLYAVRSSYGELEIGAINCWVMMGVLAAYTSVLSLIGVAIVRWGGVWDDARSIFLLLLLMFLAVSVSADDLFVQMESSTAAIALLGSGLAFSVLVFQFVLRGARIRLGAAFQIPFIVFLALFYLTPWWCSPELHPRQAQTLNWTVLLFPQVAAVLCLTLLPAVRRGDEYVANNGTPWAWPWFPWTAFGVIGAAVMLRSYALSLTFSQTGPIWDSPNSRSGIVLDTIWRPYFIVPFVLAVLLLVLEAAIVRRNHKLARRVMLASPAVLLLAWPWGNSQVSAEFVLQVTDAVGSPIWLAIWLMITFFGWAAVRKVPQAGLALLGSTLLFAVVGPRTVDASSLVVEPTPLLLVGLMLAVTGWRQRSSAVTLAASVVMTFGLWLILPQPMLTGYRATICYHVMLAACLSLGVLFKDRLASILRHVGGWWIPVTAMCVMMLPAAAEVQLHWRLLYVVGLAATCLVCAQLTRSRSYWGGFIATTSVLGYSLAAVGFRSAASVFGRNAVAAFSWSVGTLLLGALISAYKAGWLRTVPMLQWVGADHVEAPPESDVDSTAPSTEDRISDEEA